MTHTTATDGLASTATLDRQPASMSEVELTILMPCLNEAQTLRTCIDKARTFLTRVGVDGEILIADNGSTDGSQQIAVRAGARVIAVDARGYGSALIAGISAARGRYIVMGDSDDSYDFSCLDGFLAELRRGVQVVMGNRFAGGIQSGAMPVLHRWLGNPMLSGIGRLFYGGPARDFHCGLRGFERQAVLALGLRCPGMEFASEMIVKAKIHGLSMAEVPTSLSPDGRGRPPHLRSWRDGWRHLRFLLLFSPNWLFLFPGLVLFLTGAFGELALLPGALPVGRLALDVHTMLFCAGAAVLGTQLVLFSVLAKVFAAQQGVLPTSRGIRLFLDAFTVEAGLGLGLLTALGGLTLASASVVAWDVQQFQQFDPRVGMRMAIPAVTLLITGMQVFFAAMFLGVLGLREHAKPTSTTVPKDQFGLARIGGATSD